MVENERKFLVKEIPVLDSCFFHMIEQGYVSFTPEVRIRKLDDEFFITCKGDGTQKRTEVETNIDNVAYNIMSLIVQGRMIKKTRYEVPLYDGIIAELDIYHGDLEGLYTVETEFKSDEQAESFVIPEWFGEEITEDLRYKNKNLARSEKLDELIPKGSIKKKFKE